MEAAVHLTFTPLLPAAVKTSKLNRERNRVETACYFLAVELGGAFDACQAQFRREQQNSREHASKQD
jgi:hypothetical protein